MATQPTIGDLSTLFQPIQQQSALAQTLLGTKGDKLAALMYRQPMAAPAAPELKFGVTPSDNATSDFLGQGLGGGINNYLAMRGYSQQQDVRKQYQAQQKELFDLAQQRDLAAAQKAQEEAAATSSFIKQLPTGLQAIYQQSDDIGRRALLKDLADPVLGKFRGQGKGEEGLASAIPLGTAAGTQKAAEVQRIAGVLQNVGVDINTPQGQNVFHALFGFDPTTQTDVDLKKTNALKASVDLQKGQNELSAQPQMIQNTLDKDSLAITEAMLNNEIKSVDAKFAEEEKTLKIQNDKQGLINLTAGRDLFRQLQQTGKLGTQDPMEQAKIQAQLGAYGIKYNPPNSGYTTIKNKDKSVWLLDKGTGMVGKLENDGKVKHWQPLH